jgi:nitrite reductase (NADH) small subunit
MEKWLTVGPLAAIPRQGARQVRHGKDCIALFRTMDDELFALQDRCPHRLGPLSQGLVHGRQVTCPLHGWNICLASGEAQAPDHGSVTRYPVRLYEGLVQVRIPAEVSA